MEDTGFFYKELDEFTQELLEKQLKEFPVETTNFLKKEARNLTAYTLKNANRMVAKGKHSNKKYSYHKSFKTGKPYRNSENNLCCRTYNNSPVGHLIENGHKIVPRGKKGNSNTGGMSIGWQEGKHVIEISEKGYKPQFYEACEKFLFGEYDL